MARLVFGPEMSIQVQRLISRCPRPAAGRLESCRACRTSSRLTTKSVCYAVPQAPPNLQRGEEAAWTALLGAGINDWCAITACIPPGPAVASELHETRESHLPSLNLEIRTSHVNNRGGISPVTRDHVNPEAPWPLIGALSVGSLSLQSLRPRPPRLPRPRSLQYLSRAADSPRSVAPPDAPQHPDPRAQAATAAAGKHLAPRLPIYPRFAFHLDKWVDTQGGPASVAVRALIKNKRMSLRVVIISDFRN